LARKHCEDEFKGAEKGPDLSVRFQKHEISLSIPEVDDPQCTWTTNGWELFSLQLPRIQKWSVDEYTGQGTTIPSFVIRMKLMNQSEPQSLAQRVNFEGLEPPQPFIMFAREPEQNAPPPSPSTPADVQSIRGDPPTLPELLRLEIPEKVGAKYYKFGVFLLNDKTGSRVGGLKQACMGDPEDVVQMVLQEWLEGKGLPVTWESLIQTLRDTKLMAHANEIETRVL
jgi:hypothetical protein